MSPGFKQREEHRLVHLRARVGLDVGEAAAEQLARTLDGERFHLVGILAAAVVAPARIALGVLVGEHRADRLEHRRAGDVLARDQLDPLALAAKLTADDRVHRRIGRGEVVVPEAVWQIRADVVRYGDVIVHW